MLTTSSFIKEDAEAQKSHLPLILQSGSTKPRCSLPGFGMQLCYIGCAWSLTYILMSQGPTLECFCHFPLGNAKTLGTRWLPPTTVRTLTGNHGMSRI